MADRSRGFDSSKMLRLESRFFAFSADVDDFEWPAEYAGEGECSSQDLSPALAIGAIDPDNLFFRRTRHFGPRD
jgi:hypothetical protein